MLMLTIVFVFMAMECLVRGFMMEISCLFSRILNLRVVKYTLSK